MMKGLSGVAGKRMKSRVIYLESTDVLQGDKKSPKEMRIILWVHFGRERIHGFTRFEMDSVTSHVCQLLGSTTWLEFKSGCGKSFPQKTEFMLRATSKSFSYWLQIVSQYLDRAFPGGPVVRTQCVHSCEKGSIPGWRTKIPQTIQWSKKKKKKRTHP